MELTERGHTYRGKVKRETPSQARPAEASSSGVVLVLYFLTLLLPVSLAIGSSRMNLERILMMIMFVPFAARIFSGKVGKITVVDYAICGFGILLMVALYYNHGTKELSYGISQVIEVVGGYMAGRVLIRTADDFRTMMKYFLLVLLILLPQAAYELVTGSRVWVDVLSHLGTVPVKNYTYRFGLTRVQTVFPHAILYGLFCSLAFSSTLFLYKDKLLRLLPRLALVVGMTIMSLSSAPMLGLILQSALIVWGKLTRGAYTLLAIIVGSMVMTVQLISHRGAVAVFISHFTLDPQTGYWRLLIWQFGSADAMAHPWFGIGQHDWARPYWMYTASVDNHWLLMAMKYGMPALSLLLGAFILHTIFAIRAPDLEGELAAIRKAYVITMVGLMFVLATVAIWDILQSFVMFLLGAGAFLYLPGPEKAANPVQDQVAESAGSRVSGGAPSSPRRELLYSRFPQVPGSGRRTGGVSSGDRRYTRRRDGAKEDL